MKLKSTSEIKQMVKDFKKLIQYDEYLQYYYIRKKSGGDAIDFLIEGLNNRIFKTSHTRDDIKLASFIASNERDLKSYIFKVI